MQSKFRPTDTDVIDFTLLITMPLAAWKKLRDQLLATESPGSYPSYNLRSQINDLVAHAEKHWSKSEDDANA